MQNVITRLPRNLPCGVVIVQHMPAGFTRSLAERLDAISAIAVKEAEDQDIIKPGQVYIAPGNFHMQVQAAGGLRRIALNQNPPLASHRPAVDVLFDSAASLVGKKAIGVILTGMGKDGAQGLLRMRQAGARTFGQDEGSCVVYGMPREAYLIGGVEEQYSLDEIPRRVLAAVAG